MQHPRILRRRWLAVTAVTVMALALGACTSPTSQSRLGVNVVAPCNAALCHISQDTWQNHIDPRHCQGSCVNDNKSIFVAGYCGSLANAVSFCQALMGRPNCAGVQQPNGRVAYTADFAANVGTDRNNFCHNTLRGTVIHDPNTGAVVTQFPGNP